MDGDPALMNGMAPGHDGFVIERYDVISRDTHHCYSLLQRTDTIPSGESQIAHRIVMMDQRRGSMPTGQVLVSASIGPSPFFHGPIWVHTSTTVKVGNFFLNPLMMKVPKVSVSLHVQADSSDDFTRLLLCRFRSPPLLTYQWARSILQLHIASET